MNRLRRMEIFRAVVDAEKFSQAAENLGLSKSAVSHAISDLEAYLGTQLINRDNRQFQLTADGKRYNLQCRSLLSDLNAVENTYRQEKTTIDGHISITAPISFGVSRLSPILTEFLKQNPDVQLSVSLSEHNVDLVQAGLDIAVRIGHLNSSALKARRLSSVQLILCASPDFIKNNPDIHTIKDLEKVNTLRYRWTPKWIFIHDGRKISYAPKGSITSDSGEALLKFVVGGQGVSFLPDFIIEEDLAQGNVVRILPEYEGEILPVHAVFLPSRHKPVRVKRLIDFLVQGFANTPSN